jgi:hypothetical protein
MPREFTLELHCQKNGDGTYNGAIWDDGQQVTDPDYIILNGNCNGMHDLWRRASDRYKRNPKIVGHCVECFPEGFFEGETLYPE